MGYRPWGCKESDTTEQLTHTQEKITVYLELKPCSSVGKESACSAGDKGSIPGMGRCHGEVNGNPVEYSSLGNPMDRGACGFTVHGVARVGHDLASKQQ